MMTRSAWDKLSEKAQWDIKVALRGPDSLYGEVLKWYTTSVIRGQVSEVFRVGGQVNPDLELVVLPSGPVTAAQRAAYNTAGVWGWNYTHFCDHVRVAADWLGVPCLNIEAALWHDIMQERNVQKAGDAILQVGGVWNAEEEEMTGLHYPPVYQSALLRELARHLSTRRYY